MKVVKGMMVELSLLGLLNNVWERVLVPSAAAGC